MSVPDKHLSKSKVRRRRSQLRIARLSLFPCLQCKGPTVAHRACMQCGAYAKKASVNKPLAARNEPIAAKQTS